MAPHDRSLRHFPGFTATLICSLLLSVMPLSVAAETLEEARTAVRMRQFEKAVEIYEQLAEAGDAKAQ
ncbi:MAG: hypothetical protein DIZ77_05505 [endosymbiont of Seepiophila jonesi]|uniref:Tetratricopeptide repeat protein n=1 Tax=endosymbiont of Lamellibrachia luymesi TaxID=2200907 RepID=A0A370DWL4_9GAMM|nr:MAG: hypothetical protein DIZ79_13900 [endosymbiont of Lamellibrachia luymesi]RDH93649.1 MAG: hypothetical protein DIZ77_05505 [endosymbiont of Seepiophila jonesi]